MITELFLVKSMVSSGILFVYYLLFLKNRKLHSFNRFYLLGSVLISLFIPFLHFEWYHINRKVTEPFTVLQAVFTEGGDEALKVKHFQSISFDAIALLIYSLFSLLFFSFLLARIYWISKIKRNNKVVKMGSYNLIYTDLEKAPFTFMNNLFWRNDIDIESTQGRQILRHEIVHIKQKHTLDKLLVQIVILFCWFNPFYWLMARELSVVHEFIADEEMAKDKDTETFAKILLLACYGNIFPDIVHPFFHSQIKRRIFMINQLNKTRFMNSRKLISIPVLLSLFFLFSFTWKNVPENKSEQKVRIVLDAGHGGIDNGAKSKSGLLEKNVNLKIVNKIAELAGSYNIEVVQTRNDDNTVSLEDRVEKADNSGAQLFVSVHVISNDSIPSSVNGYEVIADERNPNYENSKTLASALIPRLHVVSTEVHFLNKHLFVLKDLKMPGVLIECGHIDNAEEMAIVRDKEKLEELSRSILSGIVDYANRKDKR